MQRRTDWQATREEAGAAARAGARRRADPLRAPLLDVRRRRTRRLPAQPRDPRSADADRPAGRAAQWLRTVLRHEAYPFAASASSSSAERSRPRPSRGPRVWRIRLSAPRPSGSPCRRGAPAPEAAGGDGARAARRGSVLQGDLRAHGLDVHEGESVLTEGRRALLERLAAIESGAECERWLPLLSALATARRRCASARSCARICAPAPACRATLRDFHEAPAQVALLVPRRVVPRGRRRAASLAGQPRPSSTRWWSA